MNKDNNLQYEYTEYFEILDISELSGFLEEEKEIRAFIACKVGKIRLIDNIKI